MRKHSQEPSIALLFGAHLRMLREERGFSQERLAEEAGVHRTYVGMVERAERNVTLVSASRFCEALGLSLSEFLSNALPMATSKDGAIAMHRGARNNANTPPKRIHR